jgi:hypothetical protein
MTTSASWNYSLTALGIIDMALENLGILGEGDTASSAQSTTMLRRLNVVAKQFQGMNDVSAGLKVHTRQRITLFLAKGQQTYQIGPASTDARSATTYGRTTVGTAYVSGTSLVVTAASDTTTFPGTTISMANSDFIGVELDDGTIGWTTIASIAGAPTITLTAGFSVAAASGNYVYWFTSRAQRFPHIETAVIRDENFKDTDLYIYRDVTEYDADNADKYADSDTPGAILVEPLRITTKVTLDIQPTDVTKQIVMTVLYPAEDYDASSDDIAFPQEWLRPLSWALAFESHSVFGRKWTEGMELNRKESLTIAKNLNPEVSNLYFQPEAQ